MTQSQSKTTEQSIIDAAESLFLDKGYAKTSTVEIARVAGCNQALVHYYYRSKENLFRQIFEKKANMFVSSLLEINGDNLPFEEKLKKQISTHFEMVKVNKKLPVLLFNEVATNADLAQKLIANIGHLPLHMVKQIQLELDAEYKQGSICKTDAKSLLYAIFSMNVMAFMSAPILKLLADATDEQFDRLLEKRKTENIKFILKSLKP
jgi:TetR/AcrR family transcriptional regulator